MTFGAFGVPAVLPTLAGSVRAHAGDGGISPRFQAFASVVLTFAMIRYLGAWFWPSFEYTDMSASEGIGGSLTHVYRAFHACAFVFVVLTIAQWGLVGLLRPLLPFMPFMVAGLVASSVGFDPIGGFRALLLFVLMALTAASAGFILGQRRVEAIILMTFAGILLVSVLTALFLPTVGRYSIGIENHWRGLFTNKNELGWISALALLFGVFTKPNSRMQMATRWAVIALSLLCLQAASSQTAIISVIGSAILIKFLLAMRRYASIGTTVLLSLSLLFLVACLVFVQMPLVERLFWALGRNLTFTGRDSIWVAYYQKMIESPWIGRGPGAFTSISPFTTVIANRLREFGFILSPHSMFLGVFGDGGVVGLIAMLLGYCYVLFDSIRNGLRPVAGSLALVILFGGVTETHEIFGPGPGMFLLIIALSMRGSSQQLPAAHRLKVVAPALHAPPCFASNEGNVENEPRGTH